MVAQVTPKGRTCGYSNWWTKAQQIVAVGTRKVRVKSTGCEAHDITPQIVRACWSLRAWTFTLSTMESGAGRLREMT